MHTHRRDSACIYANNNNNNNNLKNAYTQAR